MPFSGWAAITNIYYDPAADTMLDTYLSLAANDAKVQLERVRPTTTMTVVTTNPTGAALRLLVNAADTGFSGKTDDAHKIVTSTADGVTITGKTPLGASHGLYTLLHDMGYRWFWPTADWWPKPAALDDTIDYTGAVVDSVYDVRSMVIPPGFMNMPNGQADYKTWRIRNRAMFEKIYPTNHGYDGISTVANAETNGDPNSVAVWTNISGATKKNLDPEDAWVRARANEYVDRNLALGNIVVSKQLEMAVPASPLDGPMGAVRWQNADKTMRTKEVANGVFSLAAHMADRLTAVASPKLLGILSYSNYSNTPDAANLRTNMAVAVTDQLGVVGEAPSVLDRIAHFAGAGCKTISYVYPGVDQYTQDHPFGAGKRMEKIGLIQDAATVGATGIIAEMTDTWAPKGDTWWAMARWFWTPAVTYASLRSDFFTKLYGSVASTMQAIWDRFDSTGQDHAQVFTSLESAYSTNTDPEIDTRIRHIILWAYWEWKWSAKATGKWETYTMTQTEAQESYAFMSRISTLRTNDSKPRKGDIRDLLKNKYGVTDTSAWEDTTPYTVAEVETMFTEAKTALNVQSGGSETPPPASGSNDVVRYVKQKTAAGDVRKQLKQWDGTAGVPKQIKVRE